MKGTNMECGFETIGNAALIIYDKKPVLTCDPWIQGDAYFGSWILSHDVPEEQKQAVLNSEYIWFSHGHPDHLNPHCLPLFKNQKILLPDHHGKRIYNDLKAQGFQVRILKDREWFKISDRVRVQCIADPWQDAVILIEVNGRLIANINDTAHHGWVNYVRKVIKNYPTSFLLSLCCFGDVDMINFYDEEGKFIIPNAAKKEPLGSKIAAATESFGAKYFVPFSSMHIYQRKDTAWIRKYGSELSDFNTGFKSDKCKMLPPFIKYNCISDQHEQIPTRLNEGTLKDPSEFGDNWSDLLEKDDVTTAKKYFQSVEHLWDSMGYINLKVGGKDNLIEFKKENKHSITFEVPRNSLMTAIKYEIFDDLLIGNFMKTTLHGDWNGTDMAPHLVPYLTKYADNGLAKTKAEVKAYIKDYQSRSFDYLLYDFEEKSKAILLNRFTHESPVYQTAKWFVNGLKRVIGGV